MSGINFSQFQHAVGQGGFHTGELFEANIPSDSLFSWIYDCGSDQLSILHERIAKFNGAKFNVLFLSHLDSDHVAGIDNLLSGLASVEEVVLPYLNDSDWALHLAAGIKYGSLSGNFIELSADPAAWFGGRGVERLTLIEAGDDEIDTDPPRPDPVEPGPDTVERFGRGELSWSRPARTSTSLNPTTGAHRASISIVQEGSVGRIVASGSTLNWVLSPFACRPSAKLMKKFEAELAKNFGSKLTAKQYADFARTKGGRTKLRKCYDAVWSTHNLHSMALYAGPARAIEEPVHNTAWHGRCHRRIVWPGWISVGDFDTTVKRRRERLLQYYSIYADMVGHLTLPHHGSDASFHPTILSTHAKLSSAIACVGQNGYGHPGRFVLKSVASTPKVDFIRVDENPSSYYKVAGKVAL